MCTHYLQTETIENITTQNQRNVLLKARCSRHHIVKHSHRRRFSISHVRSNSFMHQSQQIWISIRPEAYALHKQSYQSDCENKRGQVEIASLVVTAMMKVNCASNTMFVERHNAVVFDDRLPVCDDVISEFLGVDDASLNRVGIIGSSSGHNGRRRHHGLDHIISRRPTSPVDVPDHQSTSLRRHWAAAVW